MRLTATNQTLELLTSSTATLEYTIDYHDMVTSPAFTPGSAQGSIAAATTTTVLAAPGASTYRRVVRASFRNAHASTSNTVTVKKDVGGTEYRIVSDVPLAAGEALHYQEGRGWYVTDSAGKEKVTTLSTGEAVEVNKHRANTDAATASSVTETDILNYSVPAGAMGANGKIRFEVAAEWTNNGGVASTLRVRIYLGATTLFDDTIAAPALDADRRPLYIEGTIVNQNATNDQAGRAHIRLGAAVAATTGFGDVDTANTVDAEVAFAAGALDTTAAQTLRVTLTQSVNNAGTNFTKKFASVDVTQAT